MKLIKKWWFWLIVIIGLLILYYFLVGMGIIPGYICGSTMGPNGVVNWCTWHKGGWNIVG